MNSDFFGDKILFGKIKQKDKEAFIKAYDLYADAIFRYIFFRVGRQEDAEDLASQTFLRAWSHILDHDLRDYDTLRALFYKVARNLVIDHYRRQSARPEQIGVDSELLQTLPDSHCDLFREVSGTLDGQRLVEKMAGLKDDYRELLILKYINGLSVAEIASVLGKSRVNVRVTSLRALKALRDLAEQNDGQDADRTIE